MGKAEVMIPVIAFSGAGRVKHFSEVFAETGVEAALAAGIFHRREGPIAAVKAHLKGVGVENSLKRLGWSYSTQSASNSRNSRHSWMS